MLGFVGAATVLMMLLGVCLRTLTGSAAKPGRFRPQYLRWHFCRAVFADGHQPGHEPAGAAVIGVTLPFFSAGGSSVVMMYLCVGLVLSVGLQARRSRVDAVAIL